MFKSGCIGTTSIDEEFTDKKLSIELYPNPASSFLNIELFNIEEGTQIRIFDAQGGQIDSLRIENNPSQNHNFQLNISNYPIGSYFIHVQNSFWNKTKKFVKI